MAIIAAGVTPDILDAAPIVGGLISILRYIKKNKNKKAA